MSYTTIPTGKGQITIPISIRKKYKISEETPLVIEDKGKGIITLKVMRLADHDDDDIIFYESEREIGLTFKKGIDPDVLIRAIRKIDG